jgi:hypothetical protein
MKHFATISVILFTLGAVFFGSAYAQKVNDFPSRGDPLHVRIEKFDALMRGNHWNEGAIMPHIIFPPAGVEKPLIGNQEDCAGHTAVYLAAYSHQYAVTKDPAVRKLADEIMDGILKLEAVTGVPGCVARSFNKTEKPLWHEKTNFFPMEWHASTAMPGYRWQGDLSSDKFVAMAYGVGIYYDFCADDDHKQIAADFLDRFVGRVVDYNFKLVDIDNKMTLWGNFCPDLSHEPLNALEILGGLKTAHHVTGKKRYDDAYRMLIEKHGYADEAIMAKVLYPEEWKTPWDDQLAARSYYMLFRYETDRNLLNKYRMSLNRHWHDWKNADFGDENDVFYQMLYQVLTGEDVVNEKTVQGIKNMWWGGRSTGTFSIPTDEGVKRVESEHEGHATFVVRSYWFGRHYGIINAEW